MWLLGFLWTSAGIFIGGVLAWLFKGINKKAHIIYALCTGIILGLISFEVLPEAVESRLVKYGYRIHFGDDAIQIAT